MRKKCLLFLLLVCTLSSQRLFSQKIYNTWFFGFHGGLDFNTSPPTSVVNPLIEAQAPPYYTSSICDTSGKLLFFTDGYKIWNSARRELPKEQGRWPWTPSDRVRYYRVLPLVCPYPGNDSLYYLFGVAKGDGPNPGKLISLTINTGANNNTSAIVYPQPSTGFNYFTVHADNTSFMLAGTAHCNQKDKWIVTIANGALNTFLVSPGEISTAALTTALPIPQSALEDGYSNMKFSANGEKLVIPIVSENQILVYDFNNQTGAFFNPVLLHLPSPDLLEDVELSPAGTKLYYGSYVKQMEGPDYTGVELHDIFQLDLEAGSATDIENSRYAMNSFPDRGGCPRSCFIIKRTLQLGPDGKIYISQREILAAAPLPFERNVSVIEYSDRNRDDAYYRKNYLDIGNVYKFINVSYIRSGSFSSRENGIQVKKKTCLGLPTDFSLLYKRIDSVKWDFGDPASGSNNYSAAITPSHIYAATGIFTVKAIIYKYCSVDTAITQVSIDPDPIVHIPAYIKDTIVCIGNKLNIDAATAAATAYQWKDGLTYSYREITAPGDFLVRAFNACSNDQKSFTVRFEECPCEVFTPSAFTPDNDGLNDNFKPITKCNAKDYQFKVFNRYGNMVFATSEWNKGWDGKNKNFVSPTGVYVWMLQYRNPNNNQVIRKQGTVTLIR